MRIGLHVMGALLTISIVSPACARDAPGERKGTSGNGHEPDNRCLPEVGTRYDIVMLSQNGKDTPRTSSTLETDGPSTGHTVVTGDPGRPVVLMLSSYESVIWDLSNIRRDRLMGVVTSGYEAQGIQGVPKDVPVAMSHKVVRKGWTTNEWSPCAETWNALSGKEARTAAVAVGAAMGRLPSELFSVDSTGSFDLSGGPARTGWRFRNTGIRTDGVLNTVWSVMIRREGSPNTKESTRSTGVVPHHVTWDTKGDVLKESPLIEMTGPGTRRIYEPIGSLRGIDFPKIEQDPGIPPRRMNGQVRSGHVSGMQNINGKGYRYISFQEDGTMIMRSIDPEMARWVGLIVMMMAGTAMLSMWPMPIEKKT
jgi:hypothetical protein